jgi:hypothetical protein
MALSTETEAKVRDVIHLVKEFSAEEKMDEEEALEFMRQLIRDLEAHIEAIEEEHQP